MSNSNSKKNNTENSEDFKVIMSDIKDDDTIIITSEAKTKKMLEDALLKYDATNNSYSSYLTEIGYSKKLTLEEIDKLGENAQNDLQKILTINSIIKKFINTDDIIGRVYEAITTNINTDIKLTYPDLEGRNKTKRLAEAKNVVNKFFKQVNINKFLRNAIPLAYAEGNYIAYLRKTDNGWTITKFPLGVAEVSEWEVNGEPAIQINMSEITTRLRKNYPKTRAGKAMFFENLEQELKNTYPPEVYKAYVDKNRYAKLDIKHSGTIRVNNMDRKYGLSSIFKAMKPALMLDIFGHSDEINAKSKSKKIINQVLRAEVLGKEYDKDGLDKMALSHQNLMSAWQGETVVVTSPAYVEKIEYVEPKTEDISTDKIILYRNKLLSALGISFLASDKGTSANVANMSLEQLMRNINYISEQIEYILTKWIALVLNDAGFESEFYPEVEIIDSEQMSMELKQSLVGMLFNTLGCSFETAFGILGVNVKDEAMKRMNETSKNYDELFKPHATAYNSNGGDNKTLKTDDTKNDGGRPPTQKDEDRKQVDQEYNDNMRQ